MTELRLDHPWLRLGGGAGILAALLITGSGIAIGGEPGGNSSTTEVTSYLSSQSNGVVTGTVLVLAAMPFVLWFLGTLAHLIHSRDPHSPLGFIVLAGGSAAVAISAFDGLTLTALVFVTRQGVPGTPALTQAFFDLQNGIIMPGAFGFVVAVFLAALGAAILRGAFAAPWLGWISAIFAGLSVLSGVLGVTLTNGGTTPLSYFPAIGFGVMAIASGIYMVRSHARTEAAMPEAVALG